MKSPTGRGEQSDKELAHNSKQWDAGKVDQCPTQLTSEILLCDDVQPGQNIGARNGGKGERLQSSESVIVCYPFPWPSQADIDK